MTGDAARVGAGPMDHPLVAVSSYTNFKALAHGPRGRQADHGFSVFRLNPHDGTLLLLSRTAGVLNPAFTRIHPRLNLMYTCTESVEVNGELHSWQVSPDTGEMTMLSSVDAGGTSTCYITLDKENKNLIATNYWDATIKTFELEADGHLGPSRFHFDPKGGQAMQARADSHVNHSRNDGDAQKERQADPHSHALVLDPWWSRRAFVPDLGKDCIRELSFDASTGELAPLHTVPAGVEGDGPHGPRYLEIHAKHAMAYVVNELSSKIAVFRIDKSIVESGDASAPCLTLVQSLSTLPPAFPRSMNTCGRVALHQTGNYLLCANRGHDSIAVFQVHDVGPLPGLLTTTDIYHTRGMTPRHFQFDPAGQWLIAVNQDTDVLSVFRFNVSTGALEWTTHSYAVNSPNFVCCFRPRLEVEFDGMLEDDGSR